MHCIVLKPSNPLPNIEDALVLSYTQFEKSINIQIMRSCDVINLIRYIKYIGEWCYMNTVHYNEAEKTLILSGNFNNITSFFNEILVDFTKSATPLAYFACDKSWYSLDIVESKFQNLENMHVFFVKESKLDRVCV